MSITLFGFFTALGFFLSGFFLWKRAKEEHLPEAEVFDVYIVSAIWALAISRAVTVILRFDAFGLSPLRWFSLFALSGFDGVGAVAGIVVMIFLAIAKRGWDRWATLDMYLPAILCWQTFLAILFRADAALFWALSCGILWKVEREYRLWDWYGGRRGGARPGLVSGLWCVAEGVGCFLLARGAGSVIFFLLCGAALVLTGVVVVYRRSGRVFKSDILRLSGHIARRTTPTRKPKATTL